MLHWIWVRMSVPLETHIALDTMSVKTILQPPLSPNQTTSPVFPKAGYVSSLG